MKVYIFSHTHWDREWYHSQKQFQYQLGKVFDEIIDVIENDDEFVAFTADGQTSVIEDYLEIRPHNADKIKNFINQKKIIIGPWYTMPDLWLADGEALIRNLLYGKKMCTELGGEPQKIGYVPDSFGHIEQMPAILNGFGINNYYFTRGLPNEDINGKIEFKWVSIDENCSVTAHILPGNYGNARSLEHEDNPEELKYQIEEVKNPYISRSVNPDISLGCNGTDHIRVQSDLSSIIKKANTLFDDTKVIHGTLTDYDTAFNQKEYDLPKIKGCIMGSHRNSDMLHGTWSSRIDNKIDNYRVTQKALNLAEPLSSILNIGFGKNRLKELELLWKWIMQNHAHDSICGCSQDRVHSDVERRFAHSEEMSEMIAGEALSLLSTDAVKNLYPQLVRYSGLGGGDTLVEFVTLFDNDEDFYLEDLDGNKYPVQVVKKSHVFRQDIVREKGKYVPKNETERYFTEYRCIARLNEASPCSIEFYKIKKGTFDFENKSTLSAENNKLENKYISVKVNNNGTLDVYHKKSKLEYKGLLLLSEEAETGGGYEHHILEKDHTVNHSDVLRCSTKIIESGSIRASLQVDMDWILPVSLTDKRDDRSDKMDVCHIRHIISLEESGETINVKTVFSNKVKDHRVRMIFENKNHKNNKVVCSRAFCSAVEDMDVYTSDESQNQHFASDFVATDTMAVATKGMHEFSFDNGKIYITLLRTGEFTFESGTWETKEAQLLKDIEYEYALMFYEGGYSNGKVPKRAAQFKGVCVADVYGTDAPKWCEKLYASNYIAEIIDGVKYPVDMQRCVWRKVYAHRDGWRRRDIKDIPEIKVERNIKPVWFDDDSIVLTCFKTADFNEKNIVIRFFNAGEKEVKTKINSGLLFDKIYFADMAENFCDEYKDNEIFIKPGQIITMVLQNVDIPEIMKGEKK